MESGPSSRASVVLGQWKTKTKPEKKEKQETNDIFRRLMNPMMEREGLHWKKIDRAVIFFSGPPSFAFVPSVEGQEKKKKWKRKTTERNSENNNCHPVAIRQASGRNRPFLSFTPHQKEKISILI